MKSLTKSSGSPTLQTVDRALSFLEFVASEPEAPTIQTVARALGVNVTTSYHLLRTLAARGYIERQTDLTLTLGAEVGVLFRTYQQRFNVDEGLKKLTSALADETSETAYLSVRKGNRVVLEMLVEGSQRLRVSGLFVGQSGNEHIRSSGKAVLAHLDTTERAQMLAQVFAVMTESERTKTHTHLERDLQNIRSRGWSLDEQESDIGTSSVGGPIFRSDGLIFGAIGLVTPTTRMHQYQKRYVVAVKKAASDATALLRNDPSR